MSQEKNQSSSLFAYFRREAIQEYVRHHEKTILPQFLSTSRLLFLWILCALVLIMLAVLGYLLMRISPVSLFATHFATILE